MKSMWLAGLEAYLCVSIAGARHVGINDYDGDGVSDQAVFDTVSGYWYVQSINGSGILWKDPWGWSTAKPVAGDYDGDGKWDQAVFDTVGGYWYIKSPTGDTILWANQ